MRILIYFIIGVVFWGYGLAPAFALEHTQKNGLFSMDVPEAWHWVEDPEDVIITYPDGNTVAIDIQFVASRKLSQADQKKLIKEGNDKMIKEGIKGHKGTLIDQKEIVLGGVKASQLDFLTSPPNPINVAYISFFYKGYVFTITYGSPDENTRAMMDDALSTIKFR